MANGDDSRDGIADAIVGGRGEVAYAPTTDVNSNPYSGIVGDVINYGGKAGDPFGELGQANQSYYGTAPELGGPNFAPAAPEDVPGWPGGIPADVPANAPFGGLTEGMAAYASAQPGFGSFGPDAYGAYASTQEGAPGGFGGFGGGFGGIGGFGDPGGFGGFGEGFDGFDGFDGMDGMDGYGDDMGDDADGDDDGDDGDDGGDDE